MIHSYLNLVCWEELYECDFHSIEESKIYCDSVSMKVLIFLTSGKSVPRFSGSKAIEELWPLENTLYLTSRDFRHTHALDTYPLPLNCVNQDDYFFTKIAEICSSYKRVVVGISSPQQNLIALKIRNLGFGGDIHCLGAMVDAIFLEDDRFFFIRRLASRFGLEFFIHFLTSRRRTILKVKGTLLSSLAIMFNEKKRRNFLEFTKSIK